MAKRKKTLQEKKLADLRRQINYLKPRTITTLQPEKKKNPENISTNLQSYTAVNAHAGIQNFSTKALSVNTYPFLVRDLQKTTLLTIAIISMQFILFFLLKNHIFVLPGISY